jgi:hypothetical protein
VGKQLQECKEKDITTLVAYPERNSRAKQIDPAYYTDKFLYDAAKILIYVRRVQHLPPMVNGMIRKEKTERVTR